MVKETLQIKGNFKLFEEGKLVIDEDNLVTVDGAIVYADILSGNIARLPDYLGCDAGAGEYTKLTTDMFNEIFRKQVSAVSANGKQVIREFIIDGNEAIGQLYGFGLNTHLSGGTYMNLLNQNYLHEAGKKIKIIWTIEVNV